MEQAKYDVFISYSRKDYVVNDEVIPGNPISSILDLFDKNGVKYWLDKDGIYSGEEFVKEISNAIVKSKMLVFVSSKNSNESEYTCGEILKAKKAKKLIIPFLVDECDYNEKFEILLLPLNHIDYVNQPNTALPELLRTVNNEKERIRFIEEKQNEEHLKEQKKKDISVGVKEFQRLNGEQDFLLRSLYSKSKDVGARTKWCPVCDAKMNVDVSYCESCGWHFASLYGVYGVDGKSLHDEKQLRIVRGLWKELIEGKDSKARLVEISSILEKDRKQKIMCEDESQRLTEVARSLVQENKDQQERLNSIESELHKTTEKMNCTKQELERTIKLFDDEKKGKLELKQRANYFKQKYEELKTQMDEMERRLADEKRNAEEQRLAEERKREAEQKQIEVRLRPKEGENESSLSPQSKKKSLPINPKGKSTAVDADEWIIVGASVQGNGHIKMNLPCQDSHAYEYIREGWGIAITSDGAGSAKYSHIGSAVSATRAMVHFKNLIKKERWIEKGTLPSDIEWMKMSYQVLKMVRNELEQLAKKNKCDIKDLSATIIVIIHSPIGLLSVHVGDGRAGYKDMNGEWHSLITPHKGEEANQTIFIPSDFWSIQFYEMSGVIVPESRIVREQVSAFTLMSDGCEGTSWLWNQYNESTGKYYDPNMPYRPFFDSLLETLQVFRKVRTPLEERKWKWYNFIKDGNSSFRKEADDKTMILGALYR